MLILRTSNFQGATIRPIVPIHKPHSIVYIAHHYFFPACQFINYIEFFNFFRWKLLKPNVKSRSRGVEILPSRPTGWMLPRPQLGEPGTFLCRVSPRDQSGMVEPARDSCPSSYNSWNPRQTRHGWTCQGVMTVQFSGPKTNPAWLNLSGTDVSAGISLGTRDQFGIVEPVRDSCLNRCSSWNHRYTHQVQCPKWRQIPVTTLKIPFPIVVCKLMRCNELNALHCRNISLRSKIFNSTWSCLPFFLRSSSIRFIHQSLVLRSIVLGWILIYRNWFVLQLFKLCV